MNQAAIEAVDVSRSFGEVHALNGVSLSVAEGEFFSLLGPSGCGKTTLLRIISGLDEPTSGSILIGGKDMTGVPAHKRPVNTVFQSYALFPHMTVFENVAFGLKIAGERGNDKLSASVKEALDLVRLPHVADRYPKELSGGQQQRIAFARAIVNKPFVLLLDEPLSALDPRIREEMQTELARFKRELGITFVMVTHDQTEAFALSDRIAVFNVGRLEQLGTPREIYEQPTSAFVAEFIGRTNVLHGTVRGVTPGAVAVALGDDLVLMGHSDSMAQFQSGEKVVVWIRTHDVDLVDGNTPKGNGNRFQAKILNRSYHGDSTEFFLEAGGQHMISSIEHDEGKPLPAAGEIVTMKVENVAVHVLKEQA